MPTTKEQTKNQREEDFISYIRTEKRSNVEHLEMPNGKIKKKIGTFLLYSFPFSIHTYQLDKDNLITLRQK